MAGPDFDTGQPHRPPIRLRLARRDWTLPGALPAAVALRLARTPPTTGPELVALIDEVIPKRTLDAWCAAGVTFDQLLQVTAWLVVQYTKPRRR